MAATNDPADPVPPEIPPPRRGGVLALAILVVVLVCFTAMATWGVGRATILAVSAAAVAVLRVMLPPHP